MGFVFAADTHLCNRNIKKQRTMTGDSLRSFRQILKYAAERTSSLVLGGDVFDNPRPDPQAVVDYVSLTEEYGVEIFFITGQHDSRERPWALTSRWATHMDPNTTYNIGNVNVRGLDWAPDGIADRIRDHGPKGMVFVGHQVWQEFNYGVPEASLAELPSVYELALVGDYHVFKSRRIGRTASDTTGIRVFCPGSISVMSIAEPSEKQFLWVDEQGLDISIERLETRRLIRDYVGTSSAHPDDDLHRIGVTLKDLEEEDWKPMLHVSYNPEVEDCVKRIRSVVGNNAHLWLKDVSIEEEYEGGQATEIIMSNDIIEKAIAKQLSGEELSMALQLWQSADMKHELEIIGGISP